MRFRKLFYNAKRKLTIKYIRSTGVRKINGVIKMLEGRLRTEFNLVNRKIIVRHVQRLRRASVCLREFDYLSTTNEAERHTIVDVLTDVTPYNKFMHGNHDMVNNAIDAVNTLYTDYK